jgi:LmbE family N-acetylglucosaminyl deacetylase
MMAKPDRLLPERALIIFAHPDDAENHCGGTIASWKAGSAWIGYVMVTSGNRGTHDLSRSPDDLARQREEEQRAAATILNIDQLDFLRYNDGEIHAVPSLRTELAALIRHYRPDTICTHDPWQPYQVHIDHRALGTAVIDALCMARDHLYLPGLTAAGLAAHSPKHLLLWEAGWPDYYHDITGSFEQKRAAVACHQSLLGERSPQWEAKYTQRERTAGEHIGVPYAEAFKYVSL